MRDRSRATIPGRLEPVPESLLFEPVAERPDLLAAPVAAALARPESPFRPGQVEVAAIAPEAADTATFCARYGVALDASANCVVVVGRRGQQSRLAACVVPSTTRVDVNGAVRRQLGMRKASFAPMDTAMAETGMAYGGITPLGLPDGWPLLVDSAVAKTPVVIVGSGCRESKLRLSGPLLAELPNAQVLDGLGH